MNSNIQPYQSNLLNTYFQSCTEYQYMPGQQTVDSNYQYHRLKLSGY